MTIGTNIAIAIGDDMSAPEIITSAMNQLYAEIQADNRFHFAEKHAYTTLLNAVKYLDAQGYFHLYACGCVVRTMERPQVYAHNCATCHREGWTR